MYYYGEDEEKVIFRTVFSNQLRVLTKLLKGILLFCSYVTYVVHKKILQPHKSHKNNIFFLFMRKTFKDETYISLNQLTTFS